MSHVSEEARPSKILCRWHSIQLFRGNSPVFGLVLTLKFQGDCGNHGGVQGDYVCHFVVTNWHGVFPSITGSPHTVPRVNPASFTPSAGPLHFDSTPRIREESANHLGHLARCPGKSQLPSLVRILAKSLLSAWSTCGVFTTRRQVESRPAVVALTRCLARRSISPAFSLGRNCVADQRFSC